MIGEPAGAAPVTHGGGDYRFKLCRCNGCKTEAVCTPAFDFYTVEGDPEGPLYCFACIFTAKADEAMAILHKQGMVVTDSPRLQSITLRAAGLVNRYGFDDGDILDYLDDVYTKEVRHRALFNLVRDHLLPVLSGNPPIELQFIVTSHNPVRAKTIDGVPVDWDHPPELEGEVEVRAVHIWGALQAAAEELKKQKQGGSE